MNLEDNWPVSVAGIAIVTCLFLWICREIKHAHVVKDPAKLVMPYSYRDLYITTPTIPRTSIHDLPFSLQVHCTRISGWQLWEIHQGESHVIAEEFALGSKGMRLDVDGIIIMDSLPVADSEAKE